jgi:hypothetical protein
MNEVMKQGNDTSLQVGEELAKALVAKTIDNGTAIRENGELIREHGDLIRKIADQGGAGQAVDKRLESMEGNVYQLGLIISRLKDVVQKLVEKDTIPVSVVTALRDDLVRHAQLFERPLKKTIHHTHFLGKPLMVLGGMGLVILALIIFWSRTWERAEQHAENDIKWRYIKQTHDPLVWSVLTQAEDQYKLMPDQFKKDVEEEEDRRERLVEKLEQQNQTTHDIHDLESKEKKR